MNGLYVTIIRFLRRSDMEIKYPIDCEVCGTKVNEDDDFNGMCRQCYDTPPPNL